MSAFALHVIDRALAELRHRRALLRPLLTEAAHLDDAIADTERVRAQVARRAEPRTARETLLQLLKQHPNGLTVAAITRSCPRLPPSSVRATLVELVMSRDLERPARGFYRIPNDEPRAA